jgi:hypothetical protein
MIELTQHHLYPKYWANYAPGYIGFTRPRRRLDPSAWGISYFTREDGGPVPGLEWFAPIHALVVLNERECVEALAWPGPGKVVVAPLAKYFDSGDQVIVFRKPWGWTEEKGHAIALEALRLEGADYAEELLLGHAFRGSLVGRLSDRLSGGRASRLVSRLTDSRHGMICSKLSHIAHRDGMRYRRGILAQDPALTSPRGHFACEECFEAWAAGARAERKLAAMRRAYISPVGLDMDDGGRLVWA